MQRQYEDKHQNKTPWKYSKGEKEEKEAEKQGSRLICCV